MVPSKSGEDCRIKWSTLERYSVFDYPWST